MSSLDRFKHAMTREGSVANSSYNRWTSVLAAVLFSITIGGIYGFSVFNNPLEKLLGKDLSAVDTVTYYLAVMAGVTFGAHKILGYLRGAKEAVVGAAIIGAAATGLVFVAIGAQPSAGAMIASIFGTGIVFLGTGASRLGPWNERVGPRTAMAAGGACFLGGLALASIGAASGSLALIIAGYGVLGGTGIGIGYIAPVSNAIKFFPDKRGAAGGYVIGGFGAGALAAAPGAVALMKYFGPSSSTLGIAETFLTMAAACLALQLSAIALVRVPHQGYCPAGYTPSPEEAAGDDNSTVAEALKARGFWLIWGVLFLSVSAGIGILGLAAPMAQTVLNFSAAAAAGFAGYLSLCNTGGRFLWSSLSDKIGRKATYAIFTGVGAASYWLLPSASSAHNTLAFFVLTGLALSFYGGGFATIPAYLSDLFGKKFVGAIHGCVLTAWSAAGLVGPLLLTAGRDYAIKTLGLSKAAAYGRIELVLGAMLIVAFGLVMLIKKDIRAAKDQRAASASTEPTNVAAAEPFAPVILPAPTSSELAWSRLSFAYGAILAAIAIGYGLEQTAMKLLPLFA